MGIKAPADTLIELIIKTRIPQELALLNLSVDILLSTREKDVPYPR